MRFSKYIMLFIKVLFLFFIIGIIFWIVLNIVGIGLISALSIEEYYPSVGIWYCEELQLQLSFDESDQSFIIINEEKIQCDHFSERGSPTRYVTCIESNSSHYELEETILCVDSLRLNQNELVVRKPENDKEYTFTLINNPEY